MCHAAAKPDGRGRNQGRGPSSGAEGEAGEAFRPEFSSPLPTPHAGRDADTVSQRLAPVTGGREDLGTSGMMKISASRQKRRTAAFLRRRASSSAFLFASAVRSAARSAASRGEASCPFSMASARETRSWDSVFFRRGEDGVFGRAEMRVCGSGLGVFAGAFFCTSDGSGHSPVSAMARKDAAILRMPCLLNCTMTLPSMTATTSPGPHCGMDGLMTMSPV